MMTAEKRIQEEIRKFAKRNNLDYKDIEPFFYWIEWFIRQDERKRTRELIK